VAVDTAAPPAPPVDAAAAGSTPPALDATVVAPVLPVMHERPACLTLRECGTQTGADNRLSYSHLVGGGDNRYLVVSVAIGDSGRAIEASYAGASMKAIGSVGNGAGTCQVSLFGLAGPPTGSRPVIVTVSGAPVGIVLSAVTFINVDQVTPFREGAYRSAAGSGPQVMVTAETAPGEAAVDAACVTARAGLNVFAPPGPTVQVFDALIGPGKEAVQSLRPADPGSPASITMSYRVGGADIDWATGVVSLRPAEPGQPQ
jgi:hypothetical protein